LSNLPLIGKLFQGKENFATKTELVIFLRPTVIRRPSLNTEELKNFKQFLPEELPPLTTDESFN
jgi:general secretion pathway protein D